MRLKIAIVITASIVILWHCSCKTKQEVNEIAVQKISIDETKISGVRFTFVKKIKTDLIFYSRISTSALHDKIIFYGLDKSTGQRPRLAALTYTKNLEPLNKKYFQFGQGPGDVGNFNLITLGKDNIFIHENSNRRVSILDHDWKFKDMVKYKVGMESSTINDRDGFLLHGNLDHPPDITKRFFKFSMVSFPDFEWKTLFKSSPFTTKKKVGDRYKSFIGGLTEYSWFFKGKEIFLLICASYRLLKFDAYGQMLKNLWVEFPEIKIDQGKNKDFWEQPDFKNAQKMLYLYEMLNPAATMIPLGKGFVVVRRKNHYADQCSGFCQGDYYSYETEYKGKVKVPCYYNVFELSPIRNKVNLGYSDGYIYLITEADDEYYIEKWEVQE